MTERINYDDVQALRCLIDKLQPLQNDLKDLRFCRDVFVKMRDPANHTADMDAEKSEHHDYRNLHPQ